MVGLAVTRLGRSSVTYRLGVFRSSAGEGGAADHRAGPLGACLCRSDQPQTGPDSGCHPVIAVDGLRDVRAQPASMERWTGLSFVIGAMLFAVGVLLSLPRAWPPLLSAVTYAIGAVFFTTGATLQLILARRDLPEATRRWLPLRSRTTDWLAAAIQLVGTVLFNVNTVDAALTIGAHPELVDLEVWVPDIVGSSAFLASSAIAMVPEVRARRHSHTPLASTRIAFLNLSGSVLFGVSAVSALVLRSGTDVSVRWANIGTFFGALCFLARRMAFRAWPSPFHRRRSTTVRAPICLANASFEQDRRGRCRRRVDHGHRGGLRGVPAVERADQRRMGTRPLRRRAPQPAAARP